MNEVKDIPEMSNSNYSSEKSIITETDKKIKGDMEKTKKEVDSLKNSILKKYSFTQAIGILPPQAIPVLIQEEEVPKETEKHVHLLVVIPEEKFKEINKIKDDILKEIDKSKQKIWLHIMTPVDIWEYCMDSKFEIVSAIAMAFPIHDKGILGALRVAEIHKSLVLRKFDKYVVSYVIGGSLVRGEAVKTSDVDVFIVINDTDVKRMPRLELKERLRSQIYKYISEASALAGVKNLLNVQVYLLTEFWESVKDAHPVIFTFIRDGVPLHDRGTFMPWKALLRMGKLKPSPEAIDGFMSMGDKTVQRAKRALLDIVIGDIYLGVLTPSQALLMLYGLPPPNVKETVKEMKRIFVDKEKMLEKKYVDILEEIAIKYYKGYEHEKIKEISGKEIDKLLKNTEAYLKRLKELREQIEKFSEKKTIEQIHKDVLDLLQSIFGKKSQEALIKDFDKELVKKGKFTKKHLESLKAVLEAKKKLSRAKKSDIHRIDKIRRNANMLVNDLLEYTQRCDLAIMDKSRMLIKYKDKEEKTAEIIIADKKVFLFLENQVKKITNKVEASTMDEVSKAIAESKNKEVKLSPEVFALIKKEIGDFEILI